MEKFSLTPEILDQIIFAMENQNDSFVFDAVEGVVINESPPEMPEDDGISSRYYSLPEWKSSDGFHLMEKFTSSLRNPIYREQLRSALNSGRGVFRNFKNVLKQRDDIQRLWFSFKDREMKNRVIEWYNDLCELWGVEGIGPEPVETEELVLSDFVLLFKDFDCRTDEYLDLDEQSFTDIMSNFPEDFVRNMYAVRRDSIPANHDSWSFMICETPEKEQAGYLWSVHSSDMECFDNPQEPGYTFIIQLYIRPEFRGLGLARTMLDKFITHTYKDDSRRINLKLWGQSLSLEKLLKEYGFSPVNTEYTLDLNEWGRKNLG